MLGWRNRVFLLGLLITNLAWADFRPGFFVGGLGGFNYAMDTNELRNSGGDVRANYAGGLVFRGVVGYNFLPLRLEAEMGYNRNSTDGFQVGGVDQAHSGDLHTTKYMLNGEYLFTDMSDTVMPYIGAGVGILKAVGRINGNYIANYLTANATVPAAQIIFGTLYNINDHVSASLDYRALMSRKFSWNVWDPTTNKYSAQKENDITHDFTFGFVYRF